MSEFLRIRKTTVFSIDNRPKHYYYVTLKIKQTVIDHMLHTNPGASTTRLQKLLERKSPDSHLVPADAPLPLPKTIFVSETSNPKKAVSVKISDFEDKQDFQFSSTTLVDLNRVSDAHFARVMECAKKNSWPVYPKAKFAQIRQATVDLFTTAVLVNMGDAGYGVVARQPVPAGTEFEYSGVYGADNKLTNYFSTRNRSAYSQLFTDEAVTIGSVDSKDLGRGIPSFFQHAPDYLDLMFMRYETPNVQERMQTANLETTVCMVADDPIPRITLKAKINIKAGEAFCYDYGFFYFSSLNILAHNFDKRTFQPIHPSLYQSNLIHFFGEYPGYSGSVFYMPFVSDNLKMHITKNQDIEIPDSGMTIPHGTLKALYTAAPTASSYKIPFTGCRFTKTGLENFYATNPVLSRVIATKSDAEKTTGTGKVWMAFFAIETAPFLSREIENQVQEARLVL